MLRNWVNKIAKQEIADDTPLKRIPANAEIDPEFLRLIASGALRKLRVERIGSERHEAIGTSHGATLANALYTKIDLLEEHCRALAPAGINTQKSSATRGQQP
ncbi:MAG: hypothetical protein ACOYNL_02225 [Rickettsiales bacterium]